MLTDAKVEGPEGLSASARRVLMESVDYCPMGIILYDRHLGVRLRSHPSFDVDR